MLEIIINLPIGLDAVILETNELIINNVDVDVDKIAKNLGEA